MSNTRITWVFDCSTARGSARLVLLALADRANDAGVCWPSIADIARRARLSERQARRALAELIRTGDVRKLRPGGGVRRDGKGWTNRLLVVAGRTEAELADIETAHRATPGSTELPGHRRQGSGEPNRDTGSAEPGHARPVTRTSATDYTDTGDRETINRARAEPTIEPTHDADLEEVLSTITAGTAVGGGSRNRAAMFDIQEIMADRGCDASFRVVVSRFVDPRLVRKLAAKYDSQKHRIGNAGGWWRDELRRAGVKGI